MDSSKESQSWNGGNNPASGSLVYVTRRDGKELSMYADKLDWEHLGEDTDIVAWMSLTDTTHIGFW